MDCKYGTNDQLKILSDIFDCKLFLFMYVGVASFEKEEKISINLVLCSLIAGKDVILDLV